MFDNPTNNILICSNMVLIYGYKYDKISKNVYEII